MTQDKLFVDKDKIETAIRLGVPITIKSYTLPKTMLTYMADVITEFLTQMQHPEMIDYMVYCANELTTNSKKANTKRMYFKEKGLDICNQEDYDKGMANFKEEMLSNLDHYLVLQKSEGLFVKLSLQATPNTFILEVANNCEITKKEFKRLYDKLVRARKFDSLDEVFTQVLDITEGAGLGLIIMVLMLKKLGLNEKAFTIDVVDGVTYSRVTVPINKELNEQAEPLTKAIVEYINEIPQFPESIMQIQNVINNPESTMQEIAQLISGDIGLATDLLKLVNSSAFGLAKKCMNISEAVKMIGLRGIQNLLYSVGTVKLLATKEEEQRKIWANAYKLAFYSLNVAKLTGNKAIVEHSYVCGLLHNLGHIILKLIYPELTQQLESIKVAHNIPPQVIKMVMNGMQQTQIGVALAEKWNFPEPIILTIKYKDNFEDAPKEYLDLVATICFAEFMLSYSSKSIEYYQIPQRLLTKFKITNEEQLQILCKLFEDAL